MLSYQSKAEEAFYLRLLKDDYEFLKLPREHPFAISKFSLERFDIENAFNEKIFEEGNEFLKPSHDPDFPELPQVVNISFEREGEILSYLSKMMLEFNKELRKGTNTQKSWLIESYLKNANDYKTMQEKIIDQDPNSDMVYGLYLGTITLNASQEMTKDKLSTKRKDQAIRDTISKSLKPYSFVAKMNIKVINTFIDQLTYLKSNVKVEIHLKTDKVNQSADNYIAPFLEKFLIEAEKIATNNRRFKSNIRCAAFCEIIYEKKYLINAKDMGPVIKDFATQRYNRDINGAMESGKRFERDRNKKIILANQPSLKLNY